MTAVQPHMPMHRCGRTPNFDRFPTVPVGGPSDRDVGWDDIAVRLARTGARVTVVEAYPGIDDKALREVADRLGADL